MFYPQNCNKNSKADLTRVIVQINDREKEVQEAEADLAGLQKAQLMKQRIGQVFQGVITGVQSYGFFVEIEVPAAEVESSGNPGVPLRVEGLYTSVLSKMIGMNIAPDNRHCLVAKIALLID